MTKRKSKGKRGSTVGNLKYGEFPFFDGVLSADASDAARYRYITRPGRTMELRIPANENKASCDAAFDAKIKELSCS